MPQLKSIYEYAQTQDDMITTDYSDAISLDGAQTFSAQCVVDVDTPANKAFASTDVNTTDDTITIATHGFTTGLKVQLTTSGVLPTGLAAVTDYFVVVVDADTISLATSLVNALVPTKINITAAGSGSSSVNPVAIAGATVKLQKSNDKSNWSDEGSSTNITADAVVYLEKIDPCAKWMRVAYTITAGSMSAVNHILVKGLN